MKYTLLSIVVLLGINAQQNSFPEAPFCEPYQSNIGNFFVKSFYFLLRVTYNLLFVSIGIDDLPFLSRVFQSSVQLVSYYFHYKLCISNISVLFIITFKNLPGKKKNTDILMLYDYYNFKAELIADENVNEQDSLDMQSYFYATNELLTIDCKSNKMFNIKKV